MPRGKASKIGDTMVNANGYHQTRTEEGWVGTHRLVAEEKLGRKLTSNDIVRFVDGDITNRNPNNIEVIQKNTRSLRARKARIESQLEDLQAELAEINKALDSESSETTK